MYSADSCMVKSDVCTPGRFVCGQFLHRKKNSSGSNYKYPYLFTYAYPFTVYNFNSHWTCSLQIQVRENRNLMFYILCNRKTCKRNKMEISNILKQRGDKSFAQQEWIREQHKLVCSSVYIMCACVQTLKLNKMKIPDAQTTENLRRCKLPIQQQ